jgi:hypothetical protein
MTDFFPAHFLVKNPVLTSVAIFLLKTKKMKKKKMGLRTFKKISAKYNYKKFLGQLL